MSGFPILEVAIGLSFTYLLLALICTAVTEWFARVTGSRAANLHAGICRMLGEFGEEKTATQVRRFFGRKVAENAAIANQLYEHPLIKNLSEPGKKPSYIPAEHFAGALLDVVHRSGKNLASSAPELQRALHAISPDGGTPSAAAIAKWYENQMERVSGWYTRHTQTVALMAALAITVFANADSVRMAQRLWVDPAVRAAVTESAKHRVEELGPPLETVEYEDPTTPKPTKPQSVSRDANYLTAEEETLLGQLLGWSAESAAIANAREKHGAALGWLSMVPGHLAGWLITALAVSLGAPFWFDTLKRFMNIRAAGQTPDGKRDKKTAKGGEN